MRQDEMVEGNTYRVETVDGVYVGEFLGMRCYDGERCLEILVDHVVEVPSSEVTAVIPDVPVRDDDDNEDWIELTEGI